jgi:hypothetical protein
MSKKSEAEAVVYLAARIVVDVNGQRSYVAYGSFLTAVPWHPAADYLGQIDSTGITSPLRRGDVSVDVSITLPLTADPRLAVTYNADDPKLPGILALVQSYCQQSTSEEVKLVARMVRVTIRRRSRGKRKGAGVGPFIELPPLQGDIVRPS